jgi:hypothetical protein
LCHPVNDSVPTSTPNVFEYSDLVQQADYAIAFAPSAADASAQRFHPAHHPPLPADLVISLSRLTC